ncbi:TetR family transcriptional regulator [Kineosporia sp. J2-2]|uniref:TetR family transcriptional regulator n=1 Tax=Kineosporia corallincola TaxID=2835133 RepID=A0ABS5TQA3_9ACTN|nr:TetR family transcriptional regulator [Kineosporia corallincola]
MREIAGRAGVTHGLVLRQFGSKEELFLAAVPGHRELDATIAGDRETLPERVARSFVERMEANAATDPLVVLLRSVATDQEDDEELATRVAMLGSQLVGITFVRYIARVGPLARMSPEDVVTHLSRALRNILLDD